MDAPAADPAGPSGPSGPSDPSSLSSRQFDKPRASLKATGGLSRLSEGLATGLAKGVSNARLPSFRLGTTGKDRAESGGQAWAGAGAGAGAEAGDVKSGDIERGVEAAFTVNPMVWTARDVAAASLPAASAADMLFGGPAVDAAGAVGAQWQTRGRERESWRSSHQVPHGQDSQDTHAQHGSAYGGARAAARAVGIDHASGIAHISFNTAPVFVNATWSAMGQQVSGIQDTHAPNGGAGGGARAATRAAGIDHASGIAHVSFNTAPVFANANLSELEPKRRFAMGQQVSGLVREQQARDSLRSSLEWRRHSGLGNSTVEF